MSGPLATVVVPTRSRPAELRRAIGSVLAQDDPRWELLVVDDGDGSGVEVAAGVGDDRVVGLANPGRGQVDARNAAIVRARGSVVCWLDDDDWWDDPGHVGLVLAAAEAGDAVLHRGGWLVADDGSRSVFDWDATPSSLRENNTILTSSIAYPRAAHRTVGLLDRALGGYCDWDLLLRLVDAGLPLRKLHGLGVCYAVHAGGSSAEHASAERTARFELLRARHGLTARIANHATMDAALRSR